VGLRCSVRALFSQINRAARAPDAFLKSRCFAQSRSSACQLSKGSVCASLSGAEATVAATMAAVIPFTTIEGVIAALAKIDVMHRHMAASSEGKVRHSRITRARRGVGRP
jgi:hypothetical protein